ncbi:MAG: hypothetical protein JW837_00675 [Sedimentisphaerales bacterium]|nr:hypothetical protein [Sedimentisphaerales bacterium]
MRRLLVTYLLFVFVLFINNTTPANWSETFDGNSFDLPAWQFHSYPDITKTFSSAIPDGPDDNDYLVLTETSGSTVGGSQFGVAFGSEEVFTDVRVGAVVNITGVLRNYHGLAARVNYFIDPDGSITKEAPGIIASSYLMLIHWQDGPANLRIEVFKTVNNLTSIMKTYHEEPVPGLGHARSYYAELDVVGSGPVYVTGSLYEYEGGPLLARTPTLIDTNGTDPWENGNIHDAVYPSGISAIFGMNQNPVPAGYSASFDDVSSVSDGPAAVNPSPADGEVDVSIDADLNWFEAKFATSREVWFGKKGAMEKIEPSPEGTSFDPGTFEFGQTYQWRIDQIGPSGAVTGHTWTFTASNCMDVENFDTYTDDAELMAAWIDNIPGFDYVFLGRDSAGDNSMRVDLQNQFEPYVTEVVRTFETPQDWTVHGVEAMSLSFAGEHENFEHRMYLILEDDAGRSFRIEHPFAHAVQSDTWRKWAFTLGQFAEAGVDLSSVKKLTIGFGDGTATGQEGDDRDMVFINDIELCPPGSYEIQ